MKRYTIIKKTGIFSARTLARNIEKLINQKSEQGYEIINVSFGTNIFYLPTAFVTIRK